MKLTVEAVEDKARRAHTMAQFGKPISPAMREFLLDDGLDDALTVGCMGWIWYQWLLGSSAHKIREDVEAFVDRGMEMQEISPKLKRRPRHDLFCFTAPFLRRAASS